MKRSPLGIFEGVDIESAVRSLRFSARDVFIMLALLKNGPMKASDFVNSSGGKMNPKALNVFLHAAVKKGFIEVVSVESPPKERGGLGRPVYDFTPVYREVFPKWLEIAKCLEKEE